jgi:organic hydroperoxide reductase OsmC/OhrA
VSPSVTTHRARVVWDGDRDDLRAHTVELSTQTLAASSAADRGGNPTKADPEELLVAAASACHMLWFLDFARRDRLRVAAYEDDPEGVLEDESFKRIVLRPRVQFAGEVPFEANVDRLHDRAHEACFVANSLNCPVEVQPRWL